MKTTPEQRADLQTDAFIEPPAEIAGMKLRPFSAGTLTIARKLRLSVVTGEGFDGLTNEDKQKQLTTLLFIQAAPLPTVLKAVAVARKDFAAFEDEYLLPFELTLPVDAIPAVLEQLQGTVQQVAAGQIEIEERPSHGKTEDAPPNS